jgi:DNA-binding NtrC family response regulator
MTSDRHGIGGSAAAHDVPPDEHRPVYGFCGPCGLVLASPGEADAHRPVCPGQTPAAPEPLPYADAKEVAMQAFHKAYLAALLASTGGNISQAARRAGLDRSNFRRVLRRWGFHKEGR